MDFDAIVATQLWNVKRLAQLVTPFDEDEWNESIRPRIQLIYDYQPPPKLSPTLKPTKRYGGGDRGK